MLFDAFSVASSKSLSVFSNFSSALVRAEEIIPWSVERLESREAREETLAESINDREQVETKYLSQSNPR